MRELPDSSVDLAFSDPPFNIGYDYDEYVDKLPVGEYVDWCKDWLAAVHRLVKPTGSFYLMTGDWFASELDVAAKAIGFIPRSKIVWYYTFGQNNKNGFTRAHTNIFYYVKHKTKFKFNKEASKVPSARQVIYKDKRAKAGGRLPDDVWMLFEHQFTPRLNPEGDVWYNSRVAGTFHERTPNASCQVPRAIMDRILKASSDPGDLVLDNFCGSGVTAKSAIALGRNFWTCDISQAYIKDLVDAVSRETGLELTSNLSAV